MTQQSPSDLEAARRRRGRGVHFKPFPTVSFESALLLPKGIAQYGVNGEMERRALFAELKRAPESGRSKALVTNAVKYGLIARKRPGDLLALTDNGRVALAAEGGSLATAMRFQLALEQFWPFSALYEKMKGQPFHEGRRLKDELVNAGVVEVDRDQAAEVFAENLRFLGLVQDSDGMDYVQDIADFRGVFPQSSGKVPPESPGAAGAKRPALHIDIQVHIDPTASAEQIDHIFASMARHFYGDEA